MFLPENIDLAHSEKYSLSIRLAPNGFSFYFHCEDDPSVFHFQKTDLSNKLSYSDNIKKLIFDLGFFSHPFKKTTVIVVTPNFTLIPQSFFDPKLSKEIIDSNFHNISGITLYDYPEDKEYYILYNMDEDVHSFLKRHLSNPVFKHHTTSLLKVFNTYSVTENRKKCFLDFHDGYASVLCYNEDKLLTANIFQTSNNADTTYYIASFWEKLELDQTKDTLFISGETDIHLVVTNDLKKLINHVERVELNPKVSLTKEQKLTLPTNVIASLCE